MTYTQICPRCEQSNQCGTSEDPTIQGCWCSELKPSEALLQSIKDEWGTDSCLCRNCLSELIKGQAHTE